MSSSSMPTRVRVTGSVACTQSSDANQYQGVKGGSRQQTKPVSSSSMPTSAWVTSSVA